MYLLAFETAFGKFSIALFRDTELVDNYLCEKENEQAELLIPALEEVLARNKIKYSDLSYIAVGIGPGSFTGVRIGMATAKGLALATGAKLIGVSSLEAAAHKQGGGDVYINAQRGQAYLQKSGGKPELVDYAGEYSPLPDAEAVGRVALTKLDSTGIVHPLYIRKPDAKFKLHEARKNDVNWLVKSHAVCFENKWDLKIILDGLKTNKCIIADRLGFVMYEIIDDECEIKTIATLPEARRKGVADYLWAVTLKNCREKNVQRIFLEVESTNMPAVKFYERHGFDTFSGRRDYYGMGRHALMMQLKI